MSPTITQEQLISAIKGSMLSKWNIPVYGEYPSDSDVVRFGVYTSEIFTVSRTPHQLGVTSGSSVYLAKDQFSVVYVSFQDDPYADLVNGKISELVTYYATGSTIPLMDGYFERDLSQSLDYGVNREKYTWTFDITRLEFQ